LVPQFEKKMAIDKKSNIAVANENQLMADN